MSTSRTRAAGSEPKKGPLTEEIITCFREAVVATFGAFWGDEPRYIGDSDKGPEWSIVGMISLTGALRFSMMIGVPKESTGAVAARFVGMPMEFDDDDMGDVFRELANVVAGDVIARLDAIGTSVSMGLPTVARGLMEFVTGSRRRSAVLNFEIEGIAFWVRVVGGE